MKKLLLSLVLLFSTIIYSQGHPVVGKWKTIDDETGKPVSVVDIFESRGKIYGRVIEVYNPKNRTRVCENCNGDDHNKPIVGLLVIKGLTKEDDEYTNGKILDPKSGKLYKCYIALEGHDKLKVRGYIGISLIGRSQIWERIK
ncbi:MAG TPA: DUF2147 domain-containing protein [Flavobacterium sp.]|nr:DUF2147 domain-containing protein [Flavobacterium sp.]